MDDSIYEQIVRTVSDQPEKIEKYQSEIGTVLCTQLYAQWLREAFSRRLEDIKIRQVALKLEQERCTAWLMICINAENYHRTIPSPNEQRNPLYPAKEEGEF